MVRLTYSSQMDLPTIVSRTNSFPTLGVVGGINLFSNF